MPSTQNSDAAAYDRAAADFAEQPNSSGPILAMLKLAMGARSMTLRRWAAKWLYEKCNVEVTIPEIKVRSNATSAKANHIRR